MEDARYQEYIDLLKEARNLVLTGAPGTGKTYMAREIAKEMGCSEEETCFVQFHPSYDYTDFVEGLRPKKDRDQMGFERRDGVFKEFCKRAAQNLIDSQKSVGNTLRETLEEEPSAPSGEEPNEEFWEEKLWLFAEEAIKNGTVFPLAQRGEFTIKKIDKKRRKIYAFKEGNKDPDVPIEADKVINLLTKDVQLEKPTVIPKPYSHGNKQVNSYVFIIVQELRKKMKKRSPENVMTVEKESDDINEVKPYVFIIDEINRGESSKIFGELFYAIDPGYRGKTDVRVKTQYQNLVPPDDVFAKGFFVPENVYILATMNDIDRSVESMDFAMRRRFTWHEVTPEDTASMLDGLLCAQEAKSAMTSLNEAISETEGLGPAYAVGPAYFLKLGDNGGDFDKLWTKNIRPLLREYLRGFRNADETLERFGEAYREGRKRSSTPEPLT